MIELLLTIFLLYTLLVIVLDKKGILKKYNISCYGPILMIRTQRGQRFLDRLAVHKRFWRGFANLGIPMMLLSLVVMFILVIFLDYVTVRSIQAHTLPPAGKFNEPRNIFLIPGLNEFIPLTWGIIGLIVTLIVHEFSHAILCKVEGIKVKSMGILLALVPIGGFAEPDEEQLLGKKEPEAGKEVKEENKKIATKNERVRVLAAGVMANFATAFFAFAIFFALLGMITPVGDVMITKVIPGSPADAAGVPSGAVITKIDNVPIKDAQGLFTYLSANKKEDVTLNVRYEQSDREYDLRLNTSASQGTISGVKVFSIVEGSPAEKAGIQQGMVITRLNDTDIRDLGDFIRFLNSTVPGQKVKIHVINGTNGSEMVFNLNLGENPSRREEGKGFIGVYYSQEEAISYPIGIGVGEFPATGFLHILQSIPSMLGSPVGWGLLFGLPIIGPTGESFPGFSGMLANFYEPAGFGSYLGVGIFWILNSLLWIGWLNFYVGLFNCLPAVPLDGGHVFRDVIGSIVSRLVGNGEKVEKISNYIVGLFSLLVLVSFIFMFIAPIIFTG